MTVATRTASLVLVPLATSHAAIMTSRSISDVLKSLPALQHLPATVLSGTRHAPWFQASLQVSQHILSVRLSTLLLPLLWL